MIACNVHAPNNHNATYFENMKDIILDMQAGKPNHSLIIMGDFNTTLENRDRAKGNADTHEIYARTIIRDIMFDTNTKDYYREITPTGGFTWQRGDTMSRLDMVLASSGKAKMCTNTMVD
jgi:exonuclease III